MCGGIDTWVEGDGHVHLYETFDVPAIVAGALERSHRSARPELLLVVDPAQQHGFAALRRRSIPGRVETGEPESQRFERGGGCCVAVAGHQYVSTEGLEVLAIGIDPDSAVAAIPDRARTAIALVAAVLEADAAAVLPWGLGKWLGARGSLVASLCEEPSLRDEPRFLLGDVGQRFRPWPSPRVFRSGVRVLAGSDPLPVPGAEQRIGQFGFRLRCNLDPERPARSFLSALAAGVSIETRGRRETMLSTLREQRRYRARIGKN